MDNSLNEIYSKEELLKSIKNDEVTKEMIIYIYKQMLVEDYKEYLYFLDLIYKNITELKHWYDGIKMIGL